MKKPRSEMVKELARWINSNSLENLSDTPDFILAEYLVGCLEAFSKAVYDRENWYGRETSEQIKLEVDEE